MGPRWTAPRRGTVQLGQPSFSAEAQVEADQEREAQCRHRLPLGVGTGNPDQKVGVLGSRVFWVVTRKVCSQRLEAPQSTDAQ